MAEYKGNVEALALEPRDVSDGVIRVRNGKGGKARTVALDPEAVAVLELWLAQRPRSRWVFCTLKGEAVTTDYVRHLMARLRRKAGIAKRCNPHGLRHTMATGLLDEGTDLRVIQKALGHTSLGVTSRYVDHLRPTAVIDALKARVW